LLDNNLLALNFGTALTLLENMASNKFISFNQ
jgi:hypothetical protein